jgi:hypothetical protein
MNAMGLKPNQYVAAHLRALYAVKEEDRADWYIQMFTENALACATNLRQGMPIFFASDSHVATEHALKLGKHDTSTNVSKFFDHQTIAAALSKGVVVSEHNPNPPWHLDARLGPVEKFYDTFVDLYLMALAGCVTYNMGGYGHWALLIGGNVKCSLKQEAIGNKRMLKDPCKFQLPNSKQMLQEETMALGSMDSLFLPPMTDMIDSTSSGVLVS